MLFSKKKLNKQPRKAPPRNRGRTSHAMRQGISLPHLFYLFIEKEKPTTLAVLTAIATIVSQMILAIATLIEVLKT